MIIRINGVSVPPVNAYEQTRGWVADKIVTEAGEAIMYVWDTFVINLPELAGLVMMLTAGMMMATGNVGKWGVFTGCIFLGAAALLIMN
jgi:hypothetical protein